MGQLMVFRPEALAAVGGPACAEGQLVDDMHIGRCLHAAGYANVMIRERLAVTNRGTSFGAVLAIYRRWMLFGHGGLSPRSTWPLWWRGISAWLALAMLAGALIAGAPWVALLAAAVVIAHGESLVRLHERAGGARIVLRLRWFSIALFVLAPFVVASMAWRTVDWRGRAYDLRHTAPARRHGRAVAV
jgi:ceramide glucosyltransferase